MTCAAATAPYVAGPPPGWVSMTTGRCQFCGPALELTREYLGFWLVLDPIWVRRDQVGAELPSFERPWSAAGLDGVQQRCRGADFVAIPPGTAGSPAVPVQVNQHGGQQPGQLLGDPGLADATFPRGHRDDEPAEDCTDSGVVSGHFEALKREDRQVELVTTRGYPRVSLKSTTTHVGMT
jgi:hypothetical protein